MDEPGVDGEVPSAETEEEARAARLLRRKTLENQRSHARAKKKKESAASDASGLQPEIPSPSPPPPDATDRDTTIRDIRDIRKQLEQALQTWKLGEELDVKDPSVKTLQLRVAEELTTIALRYMKQTRETREAREVAAGLASR